MSNETEDAKQSPKVKPHRTLRCPWCMSALVFMLTVIGLGIVAAATP